MGHIEGAILSSFRAGILAIRSDGTVNFINPIGAKILEGCSILEGENIHPRAGENVFFRSLSEALSMSYLPTRLETELPGRDGERQNLGFTLSELKEGENRVGICAFFKDLTHVEMTEDLVRAWCESGAREIAANPGPAVQSAHAMQEDLERRIAALHAVADRLYGRWILGLR